MASSSSTPARPRLRRPRLFRGVALVVTLLFVLSLASPTSSAGERKNASEEVTATSTSTSTTLDLQVSRPPRPVVLWHGMGDSCCSPRSMGALRNAIRRVHPGTHVLSLDTSFDGRGATDDDASADVLSSFFGDVNRQVDKACRAIRDDPKIKQAGEFDAVGFSQGGLFLRAMIQRCFSSPESPLRAVTLVTLGSPHQGVTAFPSCSVPTTTTTTTEEEEQDKEGQVASFPAPPSSPSKNLASPSLFCRAAEALISRGAFAPGIRTRVVQAQYFKPDSNPDPLGDESAVEEYQRYLELNPFLPRVNGEREEEEEEMKHDEDEDQRRRRPPRPLASLRRLVLFRFEDDTVVVPRDSAWFSELRRGRVVPMRETPNFTDDVLGLRELDERKGRKRERDENGDSAPAALLLKSAPGNHMRFTLEWFVDEVVRPFLNAGFELQSEEEVEEAQEKGELALS